MSGENVEKLSVREIIQRIRDGLVDPKSLPKKLRQACVEVLFFEGGQQSTFSGFFNVCDKTISRDFKDICKKNALEATPELTKELVGELVLSARGYCARVKQLSRSADASVGDKIKAEYIGWRVQKELIETLDLVGYLIVNKIYLKLDKKPKNKPKLSNEVEKDLERLSPMDRDRLIEKLTERITQMESAESQENSESK